MKALLNKTISSSICAVLVFTMPGWADAFPHASTPSFPSRLGAVVDSYQAGTDKRFVYIVQDLHIHPAVQKKIRHILEFLIQSFPKDVSVIGVEGAEGSIPTLTAATQPNPSLKRKVADVLMDQGELTGAEAFAIEQGRADLVWGVEDEKAYQANRKLYLNTLEARKELRTRLEFLQARVSEVARRMKGTELRSQNAQAALKSLDFLIRYLSQQATDADVTGESRHLQEMMARVKALGVLSEKEMTELHERISAQVDFYSLALVRNEPMVTHLLSEMQRRAAGQTGILVAGGFHAQGLGQALRKAGISYAVIMPAMEDKDFAKSYTALYEERLADHHASVETLQDDLSKNIDYLSTVSVWLKSLTRAEVVSQAFAFRPSKTGVAQRNRRGAAQANLVSVLGGGAVVVGGVVAGITGLLTLPWAASIVIGGVVLMVSIPVYNRYSRPRSGDSNPLTPMASAALPATPALAVVSDAPASSPARIDVLNQGTQVIASNFAGQTGIRQILTLLAGTRENPILAITERRIGSTRTVRIYLPPGILIFQKADGDSDWDYLFYRSEIDIRRGGDSAERNAAFRLMDIFPPEARIGKVLKTPSKETRVKSLVTLLASHYNDEPGRSGTLTKDDQEALVEQLLQEGAVESTPTTIRSVSPSVVARLLIAAKFVLRYDFTDGGALALLDYLFVPTVNPLFATALLQGFVDRGDLPNDEIAEEVVYAARRAYLLQIPETQGTPDAESRSPFARFVRVADFGQSSWDDSRTQNSLSNSGFSSPWDRAVIRGLFYDADGRALSSERRAAVIAALEQAFVHPGLRSEDYTAQQVIAKINGAPTSPTDPMPYSAPLLQILKRPFDYEAAARVIASMREEAARRAAEPIQPIQGDRTSAGLYQLMKDLYYVASFDDETTQEYFAVESVSTRDLAIVRHFFFDKEGNPLALQEIGWVMDALKNMERGENLSALSEKDAIARIEAEVRAAKAEMFSRLGRTPDVFNPRPSTDPTELALEARLLDDLIKARGGNRDRRGSTSVRMLIGTVGTVMVGGGLYALATASFAMAAALIAGAGAIVALASVFFPRTQREHFSQVRRETRALQRNPQLQDTREIQQSEIDVDALDSLIAFEELTLEHEFPLTTAERETVVAFTLGRISLAQALEKSVSNSIFVYARMLVAFSHAYKAYPKQSHEIAGLLYFLLDSTDPSHEWPEFARGLAELNAESNPQKAILFGKAALQEYSEWRRSTTRLGSTSLKTLLLILGSILIPLAALAAASHTTPHPTDANMLLGGLGFVFGGVLRSVRELTGEEQAMLNRRTQNQGLSSDPFEKQQQLDRLARDMREKHRLGPAPTGVARGGRTDRGAPDSKRGTASFRILAYLSGAGLIALGAGALIMGSFSGLSTVGMIFSGGALLALPTFLDRLTNKEAEVSLKPTTPLISFTPGATKPAPPELAVMEFEDRVLDDVTPPLTPRESETLVAYAKQEITFRQALDRMNTPMLHDSVRLLIAFARAHREYPQHTVRVAVLLYHLLDRTGKPVIEADITRFADTMMRQQIENRFENSVAFANAALRDQTEWREGLRRGSTSLKALLLVTGLGTAGAGTAALIAGVLTPGVNIALIVAGVGLALSPFARRAWKAIVQHQADVKSRKATRAMLATHLDSPVDLNGNPLPAASSPELGDVADAETARKAAIQRAGLLAVLRAA